MVKTLLMNTKLMMLVAALALVLAAGVLISKDANAMDAPSTGCKDCDDFMCSAAGICPLGSGGAGDIGGSGGGAPDGGTPLDLTPPFQWETPILCQYPKDAGDCAPIIKR